MGRGARLPLTEPDGDEDGHDDEDEQRLDDAPDKTAVSDRP